MLKFLSLSLLCAIAAGAPLTRAPDDAPAIEIVGPSVLLNAREMGAVQILDLRASGRAVPTATTRYQRDDAPLFVLADAATATAWLQAHQVKNAFIVPPRFIEYEKMAGVPQIEPKLARAKVAADWPLFDISERWEFDKSRLPGSQRLDYSRLRAGETSGLPRDKPFIVACRVGHRSQLVVQELRKRGYDARNLDGGLWQWGMRRIKGGAMKPPKIAPRQIAAGVVLVGLGWLLNSASQPFQRNARTSMCKSNLKRIGWQRFNTRAITTNIFRSPEIGLTV